MLWGVWGSKGAWVAFSGEAWEAVAQHENSIFCRLLAVFKDILSLLKGIFVVAQQNVPNAWLPFGVAAGRENDLWQMGRTVLVFAAIVSVTASGLGNDWPSSRTAGAAESGFRKLSPGVLTVIPSDTSADDTEIRSDLLEVTKGQADRIWTPQEAPSNTTLVERAKNREYLPDVWCLEFAYKSPRTIDVDVPVADMRMKRKRVWYLIYRVKNTGGRRTVIDKTDATKRTTEAFEKPVLFMPHFVLEGLEAFSDDEGMVAGKSYLDRVVPSAMESIRRREDQARELFDSARMASKEIAPGEERWGVAIWEDVDPRIDFFSIFVTGLTNSMRWRAKAGATFAKQEPVGASMEQTLECLRLDFWRPGDASAGAQEMSVGYAGLFERITMGTRLIEAMSRPPLLKSNPVAALDQLGLQWSDLLEIPGSKLAPFEKVLRTVLALKDPAQRGPAMQSLFGDLGITSLKALLQALSEPLDAQHEAVRMAGMTRVGLSPEALKAKPLKSLADVCKALDAIADTAQRRSLTEQLFGRDSRRIDALARDIAVARTFAVLQTIDADWKAITTGSPRAAFAGLQVVIDAESTPKLRQQMLEGLFGLQGPALYAAATS